MADEQLSETLLRARVQAGISQAELARRSGIPQPNISAYEAGQRTPRPETAAKLLEALRERPSVALQRNRASILRAAAENKVGNVRVFGSVARGIDTPNSDVDLLVTPSDDASALDLAGFMVEVEDLIGVPVDVVSDRGKSRFIEAVSREARAL